MWQVQFLYSKWISSKIEFFNNFLLYESINTVRTTSVLNEVVYFMNEPIEAKWQKLLNVSLG